MKNTDIARLWRKLDPAHYYDAGEIAILRAYFGLRPRAGEPPLVELYEQPRDGEGEATPRIGPIRLRHVRGEAPVCDLSEAVGRLCLASVQEHLPQWASCSADGDLLLARKPFGGPDRTFTPLEPARLLCINWADSGPGFSWPEDYFVTLLPGFGRYVVTASADSTDSYGVTDFALGWFRASEDRLAGSERLLLRWWRRAASSDSGPWAYLFDTGLIDAEEAYRLRRCVWADSDDE